MSPAAFTELQLPPGKGWDHGGWRAWPTALRFRGGGCYGVQVDGIGFSEVIVFRAATQDLGGRA